MIGRFVSTTRFFAVVLAVSAVCAAQVDKGPASNLTSTPTPVPASVAPTKLAPDFQQRTTRYRIEPGDTFDLEL